MRASTETYEQVAERCSEFKPCDKHDIISNSSCCECKVSCTNCQHFTNEKYCELDIYDKIVNEL